MKPIDKIGLIINPVAGNGSAANIELARRGMMALGVRRVYTEPGWLGSAALAGMPVEAFLYPASSESSRSQTIEAASWLAGMTLDAVVVVGGDGTLADVAGVFARIRQAPALLGIGAGSTNAGALITCSAANIGKLSVDRLEIVSLSGLLAYDGEELIGVGFNDCVVGQTVVATLAGKLRDVGVVDKFAGRTIPTSPGIIGQENTLVWKTGPHGSQEIARGDWIGNIIIGLAEKPFIAKAVTGGICLAAFTGLPAGCLVADQPLVQVELPAEAVLALPPIHSVYTSLGTQERVNVKGLRKGSAVCVDGTPLKLLEPEQEVSFGVQLDVVRAIRIIDQD